MSTDNAPLRFLVVDDDQDIRELFIHMLERLGHCAHPASDGVEAVESLTLERWDYMLLDLSMPRMSGRDVLRWLGQHPEGGAPRVVVVSAWGDTDHAELIGLGAHAVLPKPLRLQQLRDVIDEIPSATL